MKKILKINSSIKGNDSFSIKLSDAIIDKLLMAHPGSVVTTVNISKETVPYLDEEHLLSFYTPEELRTAVHKETIKYSDKAIQLLRDADIIVIGVPMYNFGVPSTLKAWIDQTVRAGITFKYAEGGPEGLITGKKVYLAIASGGVFSEGPLKAIDFTEPFLRQILGFIGLKDISTFRVEGTVIPDLKESAFPKALDTVEAFAF